MKIKINERMISDESQIFFIAEAGVNHNGSLDLAFRLVDSAIEAGADAIKFQTFKTENIILENAPKSSYHIETTGDDQSQSWYQLLKSQEMSLEMHIKIFEYCKKNNIIFLSTPYDVESADLLEKLGVQLFKIASTDLNNSLLLNYISKKNIPLILSTAMSTIDEIDESINILKSNKLEEYVIMQCTGNYPARDEDSNLKVLNLYKEKFNCLIGYSDHSENNINAIASTSLGISVFEKHFTLDKTLPGPDHRMSFEPKQLKKTIDLIRQTEKNLGSLNKRVLDSEKENRLKLRKSLCSSQFIKSNTIVTENMITAKRPGSAIPANRLDKVLNKKTKVDIEKNQLLNENMFYD